jgi:hypothetical protein
VKLAKFGSPDLVRVAVCRELLDRGFGKSQVAPDERSGAPPVVVQIRVFDDPDAKPPGGAEDNLSPTP